MLYNLYICSYYVYNCFVYVYIPYKFYCKLTEFQQYVSKDSKRFTSNQSIQIVNKQIVKL